MAGSLQSSPHHTNGESFSNEKSTASVGLRFREHPLLVYRGNCTWPPVWVSRDFSVKGRLDGEIGVLKDVKLYDLSSNKCFLIIAHEQKSYIGCLFIDDRAFRLQTYDLLRSCINKTIKEIGDLDASHLL